MFTVGMDVDTRDVTSLEETSLPQTQGQHHVPDMIFVVL